MTDETESFAHLRARLALGWMSQVVRADVIADGLLLEKFQIPATRPPLKLGAGQQVSQDEIFEALRAAADNQEAWVRVEGEGASSKYVVRIDLSGAGVVETESGPTRIVYAGLLTQDPEKRKAVLDGVLGSRILSSRAIVELQGLIKQPKFEREELIRATEILEASPDAYRERLAEKLSNRRSLLRSDLLPSDAHHWEHLTAPREGSATLQEFVANELAAERRARLAEDPITAIRFMSLGFASADLVPMDLLAERDPDAVLKAIESLTNVDDHFALAGFFEICAERVGTDARFVEVGEALLSHFIGDEKRLEARCRLFGAAFIVATAELALLETTRGQPTYWRRLAAVSQASLFVRTCLMKGIDGEKALDLALQQSGCEYLTSAYRDMVQEPRWRPEWVYERFLVADAFGRVWHAVRQHLEDNVPESWQAIIETATQWIRESGRTLLTDFSSIVQGGRRPQPLVADDQQPEVVRQHFRKLAEEPSAERLLALAPWMETFAVSPAVIADVMRFALRVRNGEADLSTEQTWEAMSFAGHIAVLATHTELAEAVAETYIEKVRTKQLGILSTLEVVLRLTECAAAYPQRAIGNERMASWLEALAFAVPYGAEATGLIEGLEVLQRVDPELAPRLGRAMHTAKLAEARSARRQ